MQPDKILRIGNSLVQHGPANDRVYLMKLDENDLPEIVRQVDELGRRNGYTKLFAKVPAGAAPHFTTAGFVDEACVPKMYKGESSVLFMSKFLEQARSIPQGAERIAEVLDCARRHAGTTPDARGSDAVTRLQEEDADELAALYATVFETYPFPLHNPAFIQECMASDSIYFGIFSGGRLVAAAAAEVNSKWLCAEMTDFATLPEYRGNGAATKLLVSMEQALQALSIKTLYTIARAESFGMNVVFSRCGYTFGGILHNNTHIAGKLESMNVWYKQVGAR